MTIAFAKAQSVGNDFVLVETDAAGGVSLSDLAVALCEHHFAIGSDGLLVVAPEVDGMSLRMFNTDGTEDFCGNGLRCAAWYGREAGWVGDEFLIHHMGQSVEVKVSGSQIATRLAHAVWDPHRVPHCEPEPIRKRHMTFGGTKLVVSSLSTGSTHTIIHTDGRPEDAEFFALGPLIENHEMFPARTSVIWCWPDGEQRLALRIWERGVGETLGCGTGSSAAAEATFGPGEFRCTVRNPGGLLSVSHTAEGLMLAGTASIPYRGTVRWG